MIHDNNEYSSIIRFTSKFLQAIVLWKASTKSTHYSDIPQSHSTGAEIRHWVSVDDHETLMKMQQQHLHY